MEEEKEIKANIVNQMRNLFDVCTAKKDYDHQRKKLYYRTLTDIESPILVYTTGCSLNMVFFEDFKIYIGLLPLSVFPWCVYTRRHAWTTK